MKKLSSVIFCSIILSSVSSAISGEYINLVAVNTINNEGFSNTINLSAGDTAEVKYAGGTGGTLAIVATIAGISFPLSPFASGGQSPPIIAGPASIKLRTGYPGIDTANKGFATVEVNRAGTAVIAKDNHRRKIRTQKKVHRYVLNGNDSGGFPPCTRSGSTSLH